MRHFASARGGFRWSAGASAAALAIAAAFAVPAQAQDAPPAAAPAIDDATGVADVTDEQEVVVTGSRIARRDYAANTPIVTLPEETLENTSSFALETKLNQLPQFASSGNSQFTAGYLNTGASTLNLRNLGDNRNLVLLDGRRAQPSTNSFAIDINTIPGALIDSVEVISGGASAVYGSDAVSGVVNFKLKDDFEGVQVGANYGLSRLEDNRIVDLEAVVGGNFADGRGNAVVALSYASRGAFYNGNRDFYIDGLLSGRNGGTLLAFGYYKPVSGNLPTQAAINSYYGQFGAPAGAVRNTTNVGFNNDATTLFNLAGTDIYNYRNQLGTRFQIDRVSTPNTAQVKESFDDSLLSTPLDRYSIFGKATYEVYDDVKVFLQGMYTSYLSTTMGGPVQADNFWVLNVPRDAAHPVPAALATLLDSRPTPGASWQLGKAQDYLGPRIVEHDNKIFQITGGLQGRIGGTDLSWEVYGSHGETTLVDTGVSGFANSLKIQELISAPNYGANFTATTGKCTSGLYPFGALTFPAETAVTNPNPLPQQRVSQDCVDYISERPVHQTKLVQDVVEANLQGGLFELPAGEVRFATGLGYRYNSYDYLPDPLTRPRADNSTVLMGQFGTLAVSGSTNVKEFYAEVLIPVLSDIPFIQALEVDLAYRYSDYEFAGGVHAYKGDVSWQVFDALRLRGGYQRAVRAPNVIELFSPPNQVQATGTDYCQSNTGSPFGNTPQNTTTRAQVQALCRSMMGAGAPASLDNYLGSSVNSLSSRPAGNPLLGPETADTFTVGAVFRPAWSLPGNAAVSLSVDYYNISIDGAIGFISAVQTYDLCFNVNGVSNPNFDPANRYCATIGRATSPGGGGNPTVVLSLYENQGGIKTDGVDVQADLAFDLAGGRFSINSVVNYLNSFTRSVAVGLPFLENAGYSGGYFKWKLFNSFSYRYEGMSLGLRWRHLDSVMNATRITAPCTPGPAAPACRPDTEAYDVFDLFMRWQVNDMVGVRVGVDNLLDRDPPIVGGIPGQTEGGSYDIIGRRFYGGVSFKF